MFDINLSRQCLNYVRQMQNTGFNMFRCVGVLFSIEPFCNGPLVMFEYDLCETWFDVIPYTPLPFILNYDK